MSKPNYGVQTSDTNHLTHPKYRPDIDGLRAIAVLAVVGYHAFPDWVKGGFIGVDVFFVISGFLISTIIFGSLERNSFSFVEFYIRRIRRIFPALLVVLIASFAFGWYALFPDEYKQLGTHISGGAGFVSNLVLWKESGYFDNAAETKPLLHLWSLGIEEQFYILYPLLIWLGWKRRLSFLTITVVIALVSFWLNIGKYKSDPVADFYSPQTRFWELMVGALLAYATLYKQDSLHRFRQTLNQWLGRHTTEASAITLSNWQSILGLALIMIGILTTEKRYFPGWWALLPTLGAVLVISAGLKARFNRSVLSHHWLVWFGLISFPLYLWHWVLLSFAHIVESETPSSTIRAAAVLISIILAWLTYRFVEKPFRFGRNSNKKPAVLLVVMVVVGSAGYICHDLDGLEFRSPAHAESYRFQTIEQQFTTNSCKDRVKRINHCADYTTNNDSVMFLVGDSHVRHTFEIIKDQVAKAGFDLIAFSSGGCPLLVETNMSDVPDCAEKNLEALELIKTDKHKNKIVALTAQYTMYAVPGWMKTTDGKSADFADVFYKTISKLQEFQVVVFEQVPPIPFDPKKCINRPFRISKNNNGCEIGRVESSELLENSRDKIHDVVSKFSNVHLFSFDSYICDTTTCSAISGNDLLYYDKTHLNPVGVKYVRSQIDFEKFLRGIDLSSLVNAKGQRELSQRNF